jgi:hypothetical protein
MTRFHANDEVAVMPSGSTSAADVIRIERVAYVGKAFVRTSAHHLFAVSDGIEVDRHSHCIIVPVTAKHRAAWLAKVRKHRP